MVKELDVVTMARANEAVRKLIEEGNKAKDSITFGNYVYTASTLQLAIIRKDKEYIDSLLRIVNDSPDCQNCCNPKTCNPTCFE